MPEAQFCPLFWPLRQVKVFVLPATVEIGAGDRHPVRNLPSSKTEKIRRRVVVAVATDPAAAKKA
jgi:hypothetical protein